MHSLIRFTLRITCATPLISIPSRNSAAAIAAQPSRRRPLRRAGRPELSLAWKAAMSGAASGFGPCRRPWTSSPPSSTAWAPTPPRSMPWSRGSKPWAWVAAETDLTLQLDLDEDRSGAAGVHDVVLGSHAAEIRRAGLLDQLARAAVGPGDRECAAGDRHDDVVVLMDVPSRGLAVCAERPCRDADALVVDRRCRPCSAHVPIVCASTQRPIPGRASARRRRARGAHCRRNQERTW